MSDRELTATVLNFLDRIAPIYAEMKVRRFAHEMTANCLECGMESPIEDLFWIACHAICEAQFVEVNSCLHSSDDRAIFPGLQLIPQAPLPPYRVDFLLFNNDYMTGHHLCPPVVVELDGHDFHDKDKRQRSYEKARDRNLVRQGYLVLHFTGSDVVRDPFACAWEALALVQAIQGEFNPGDPMGVGEDA